MIDAATFLVIVSAMGAAIAGLAGLLYKVLQENGELKATLAGYEENAPELVIAIREWIASERGSSGSSPSSGFPAPSPPSRTTPPPRRKKQPSP